MLNPAQTLAYQIAEKYSNLSVRLDNGVTKKLWFFDIFRSPHPAICVEWHSETNKFGITSRNDTLPYEGYDEIYETVESAFARLCLLIDNRDITVDPSLNKVLVRR